MSDRYDIIDKTVSVFATSAKFDSHKNFKSVSSFEYRRDEGDF